MKPITHSEAIAFCPYGAEQTLAAILTLQEPKRSEYQIVGNTADGFYVLFEVIGRRCMRRLKGETEADRRTESIIFYNKVTRPLRNDCAGVYFAACGRHFKVGRAKSVYQRIQALDNASAEPVRLLGILSWDTEEEQRILHELRPYRARGEWFHSTRESLELVLNLLLLNLEREIAT